MVKHPFCEVVLELQLSAPFLHSSLHGFFFSSCIYVLVKTAQKAGRESNFYQVIVYDKL